MSHSSSSPLPNAYRLEAQLTVELNHASRRSSSYYTEGDGAREIGRRVRPAVEIEWVRKVNAQFERHFLLDPRALVELNGLGLCREAAEHADQGESVVRT